MDGWGVGKLFRYVGARVGIGVGMDGAMLGCGVGEIVGKEDGLGVG